MGEDRRREYQACEVQEMFFDLFKLMEQIMTALSDLQGAVVGLNAEVAVAVAAIGKTTVVGTADADLVPVTAAINAAAATLAAAVPAPVVTPPVTPVPPVAPAA